ncbi:MAG: recombinase family protein [Thermodesulfovibrionales bacterium]
MAAVKLKQLPISRAVADGNSNSASPAFPLEGGTALFARVSSIDQKADFERQIARHSEYAALRRLTGVDGGKEIGSGLSGHCRAPLRILRNPAVRTVVVEHRERLMRVGLE